MSNIQQAPGGKWRGGEERRSPLHTHTPPPAGPCWRPRSERQRGSPHRATFCAADLQLREGPLRAKTPPLTGGLQGPVCAGEQREGEAAAGGCPAAGPPCRPPASRLTREPHATSLLQPSLQSRCSARTPTAAQPAPREREHVIVLITSAAPQLSSRA